MIEREQHRSIATTDHQSNFAPQNRQTFASGLQSSAHWPQRLVSEAPGWGALTTPLTANSSNASGPSIAPAMNPMTVFQPRADAAENPTQPHRPNQSTSSIMLLNNTSDTCRSKSSHASPAASTKRYAARTIRERALRHASPQTPPRSMVQDFQVGKPASQPCTTLPAAWRCVPLPSPPLRQCRS